MVVLKLMTYALGNLRFTYHVFHKESHSHALAHCYLTLKSHATGLTQKVYAV